MCPLAYSFAFCILSESSRIIYNFLFPRVAQTLRPPFLLSSFFSHGRIEGEKDTSTLCRIYRFKGGLFTQTTGYTYKLLVPSQYLWTFHTVRKMDLILRSIERMLQTQLSMARRFKLQVLRRYDVKFSKMRNFTLETLRLDKLKNTGGRRTNISWIYSPRLYHCATDTHVLKAEF